MKAISLRISFQVIIITVIPIFLILPLFLLSSFLLLKSLLWLLLLLKLLFSDMLAFSVPLETIHIWRPSKLFNFQDPHPPVHLRPKYFHHLDLGRLILNEPPTLPNKLWKNNRTVHVYVTPGLNLPRVLLFDLAHNQCNGTIKEWPQSLTSRVKRKISCQ